jgi:hypothetical protein
VRLLIFLFILVTPAFGQTYNDDYALTMQINRARINKNIPRSLIVSHDLMQSARVSVQNHQYFDCFEAHSSCQGEFYAKRLKRFYPGFYFGSEIWALGLGSYDMVDAWLDSPVHAASILGQYIEFGGANIQRFTAFGYFDEGLVDFGYRYLYPIGPIVSGAIVDDYAYLTYDASSTPLMATVTIGDRSYTMNAFEGTAQYGVYRVRVEPVAGCEKAVFNVLTGTNDYISFPIDDWPIYIGTLCVEPPYLLNKVHITINKSSVKYNLETLPDQHPTHLRIEYGSNGAAVEADLTGHVKNSAQSTRIVGSYRNLVIPPVGPGRVKVYLDYRLVATLSLRRLTDTTLVVKR